MSVNILRKYGNFFRYVSFSLFLQEKECGCNRAQFFQGMFVQIIFSYICIPCKDDFLIRSCVTSLPEPAALNKKSRCDNYYLPFFNEI